eukprot:g3981.t1
MASLSTSKSQFRVIQFNVAGVNSNALEFTQEASAVAPRLQPVMNFIDALSSVLRDVSGKANNFEKDLIDSKYSAFPAIMAEQVKVTHPFLLGGFINHLQGRKDEAEDSALREGILKTIQTDEFSNQNLRSIIIKLVNEKYCSRADRVLKRRQWAVTTLQEQYAASFMTQVSLFTTPEGNQVFWKRWYQTAVLDLDIHKSKDLGKAVKTHVIPMAIFDALTTWASSYVFDDVLSTTDKIDISSKLPEFVKFMGVESKATSVAIADTLDWALKIYKPDAFTIQEFNMFWEDETTAMKSTWKTLTSDYHIIPPCVERDRGQLSLLLLKKESKLSLNEKQTARLHEKIKSAEFATTMQTVYAEKIIGEKYPSAEETTEFLTQKAAMCIATHEDGRLFIVSCVHADSNGTDNRAILACLKQLESEMMVTGGFIVGLDANCKRKFKKKDYDKGAADEAMFNVFAKKVLQLQSCYDRDGLPVSTTKKMRSFIQSQWKKSELLDEAVKDYVMCSNAKATVQGHPINKVGEMSSITEPVFEADERVFTSTFLPNAAFHSDHCMVAAEVTL